LLESGDVCARGGAIGFELLRGLLGVGFRIGDKKALFLAVNRGKDFGLAGSELGAFYIVIGFLEIGLILLLEEFFLSVGVR
jgi:hypothetical protein